MHILSFIYSFSRLSKVIIIIIILIIITIMIIISVIIIIIIITLCRRKTPKQTVKTKMKCGIMCISSGSTLFIKVEKNSNKIHSIF